MFTGFCVGFSSSNLRKCAMPAVYPEDFTIIKGIVLKKVSAVFANVISHVYHLYYIIEFITLNGNRVIFSMVCYL